MPLLLIALLLLALPVAAAPPVRPPVVEYTIRVTLDPARKTLRGSQRIIWRNPSDRPVRDLQFHLYLNAFRDRESTFMKESGGRLRSDRFDFDDASWGSIDVRRIVVSGRGEVTARGRFIHPDIPDRQDKTVMQYVLPRPIAPREAVTIDVEWEGKLPKVFARTGWTDQDYFMVGQWFPKLGVYEPRGMRRRTTDGWNCHQFHANSEFYANFGDYDVSITLPADYTVGATGRRVSSVRSGAAQTLRYLEQNVHDFAWTAGRNFKAHYFTFDPERDVPAEWRRETAVLLGVPDSALQLKRVDVTLLMQKNHDDQAERHKKALFAAIAWCGLRYGPYPYSNLTLVDPPEDGHGSGGMEYPGIFTGGTSSVLSRWPLKKVRYPEIVTIHEFAHQYWYGMVASNEFEEPWLDEGFASYTEAQVMRAAYGNRSYELPGGMFTSTEAGYRAAYLRSEPIDPIIRHAWGFSSDGQYAVNSYGKPALALRQLESEVGTAAFARTLRRYFADWSFRHPTSADFFDTLRTVTRKDVSATVQGAFYGHARFDLFVHAATTKPVKEGRRYESNVTVGRRGSLEAGSIVEFRFANGEIKTARFDPGSRWTHFWFDSAHPLASVVIDPLLANSWDTDLLNNSRKLTSDGRAAAKLTVRSGSAFTRMLQLLWELL